MQIARSIIHGRYVEREIPSAEVEVLPGLPWGELDCLMTPAYWCVQVWQHELLGTYQCLQLGRTLVEELAACLLGGYGMPAELGLAAFNRLRKAGYLDGMPSEWEIAEVLSKPFEFGSKVRNYRFVHQKSKYLAGCLRALSKIDTAQQDKALRDSLATLPGVGLKTASWVVRNYRNSDDVGIIDVHILKAGQRSGLYDLSWTPARHYLKLEDLFIAFSLGMGVRASTLDALIWDQMRRMPSQVKKVQADSSFAQLQLC